MFKRSMLCLCMFLIGSILIINSASGLKIFFSPSSQNVKKGDSAIVDIEIDREGFGLLSGFDLNFDYDSNILSIEKNDIIVAESLGSIEFIASNVEIDPISGIISIYCIADFPGDEVYQPRFMNLAGLNFLAKNVGTSYLEFSSIILFDESLLPSLELSILNPDDIALMASISTNGRINVSALEGLYITGHSPGGDQVDPVSSLTVTFSQEINEATFTSDDIHITGPSGDISIISGPILISGTTYQFKIEEKSTPGTYNIYIGPDIENQFNLLMDQDQDGIIGEEIEDRYEGSFNIIDIAGPQVLSHSPEGSVKPPFNSIDIFFNEAINPLSFDTNDVSIIGPGGGITANSITQIDASSYTISFPEQRLAGDYQVIIGPQITDLSDNPNGSGRRQDKW